MHKSAFWMISLRSASQKWNYWVRGQERCSGSLQTLPNDSPDAAGHLSGRVPVVSAVANGCQVGPHATHLYPSTLR